jgi:hypothetical protein
VPTAAGKEGLEKSKVVTWGSDYESGYTRCGVWLLHVIVSMEVLPFLLQ